MSGHVKPGESSTALSSPGSISWPVSLYHCVFPKLIKQGGSAWVWVWYLKTDLEDNILFWVIKIIFYMMDLRMKWICLNILDVWNPVLFDVHTIGVVTSIKESNISRMQQMEQDNLIFCVLQTFCFWEVSAGIWKLSFIMLKFWELNRSFLWFLNLRSSWMPSDDSDLYFFCCF